MSKINVGRTSTALTVAQLMQNSGFQIGRDEAGNAVLTVKFPGVDAMDLTRENLSSIIERLDRPQINGGDPAAVFQRSAQDTPDGGLVARFSDAKRSRSVSFDQKDRADVAILLESHVDQFDAYEAMLVAAETEAASEATATADDSENASE